MNLRLVRLLFVFLMLLIGGCKSVFNKHKKEVPDSEIYGAESTKIHEPLDISSAANDTELGSLILAYVTESGKIEGYTYYGFEIFYPQDSTFKIVNVFGEYTGGASYNPFAQPFIIRNKKLIRAELYGEVFRADKVADDQYLFYCDDYSRMGSLVSVYDVFFEADSLRFKETEKHGNYMFDLIKNKKEVLRSMPGDLVFTSRFTENELIQLHLDTTSLQVNDYYKLFDDDFLKTELISPRFVLYYKFSYGDQLEKILRIETGEDENVESRDITLGMFGGDSNYYMLTSEFLNDSVFIQTLVDREWNLDKDSLRGESIDSLVIRYKYNEQFDFVEMQRDSFHYELVDSFIQNEFKVIRTTYYSKPYSINGINCKWVYKLIYTFDDYGKALHAKTLNATLINTDGKLILSANEDIVVHDPVDFINNREENFKDINFDDYKDCLIRSETSSGSGGDFYDAYIFNPKSKSFVFSEKFSGGDPQINDSLKTVTYFLKAGYYENGTTIIHFGEKGKVLFIEKIRNELISVDPIKVKKTYKKFVNGKVVKSNFRIYVPGEGE